MNFTVYSKNGCPYCDKVKTVLNSLKESRGFAVTIYELDYDFNREEFYAEFGQGSTFPQVICENNHLGGCRETVQYLQENNLT
jgi:glutaredoxin 3